MARVEGPPRARAGRLGRWLAPGVAALFVLLAALFLGPVLFGDRAPLPTNLLMQMSPWAEATGDAGRRHQPWNPLLWDAIAQFYPWRAFAAGWMRRGLIPLWDPHQFCGTPFLANSQSAVLYPLHFLLLYLPRGLPVARAMALLAWAHLTLAGFLTYLWLRSLRLSSYAAGLGGLTFMLSGFVVTWLELPSFLTVACWLPLLFLTLRRLVGAPSLRRAAGGAVAVGLTLLGGHLQIAFYCLLGAGLYSVGILLYSASGGAVTGGEVSIEHAPRGQLEHEHEREGRRISVGKALGALALAGMLGGMLAAPQILPTMELSRHSHRVSAATGEGYHQYIEQGAMPAAQLVRLFLPDFYGNPNRGDFIAGSPANYTEFAGYIGGVGLFLALLGILAWRRRPRATLPAAALAALAILLALGTPLNRLLYFGIPGFSQSGSPARVLVLFCFAGSWLAALGAEALFERDQGRPPPAQGPTGESPEAPPPSNPRDRSTPVSGRIDREGLLPWLGLGAWVVLLAVAILIARAFVEGQSIGFGPLLVQNAPSLRLAVAMVLLAAGLPAGLRRLTGPRALSAETAGVLGRCLLAALLVGELWWLGSSFNPIGPLPEVYPTTPLLAALASGSAAGPGRVLPVNRRWSLAQHPRAVLPPNGALALGLADPQGYDSLFLGSYKGFVQRLHGGEESAPPENGNMLFLRKLDSPLLPLLAADRVLLRDSDVGATEASWPLLLAAPGLQVRRYPGALPRAFVAERWRSVPEERMAGELAEVARTRGVGSTVLLSSGDSEGGSTAPPGVGAGPLPQDWGRGDRKPARVEERGPNELRVELRRASGPGMLVVLDNDAPGWHAADAETGRPLPVYRADLTFRAVPLSADIRAVRLRYEPASFRLGLFLAVLACGALLAIGTGSWKPGRSSAGRSELPAAEAGGAD